VRCGEREEELSSGGETVVNLANVESQVDLTIDTQIDLTNDTQIDLTNDSQLDLTNDTQVDLTNDTQQEQPDAHMFALVATRGAGVLGKRRTDEKNDQSPGRKSARVASSSGSKATSARGSGPISVMLAHTYDEEKHNPKGWLMSEKLDGVRSYWDGHKMYTRNGNEIFAPREWTAKLPPFAIDGELWSGRDRFQSIVSTVRRHQPNSADWAHIKFKIFDAPLLEGSFTRRLEEIEEQLAQHHDCVASLIKQTMCEGKAHLATFLDTVCEGKGEGAMIKNPRCSYENARSWSLLKVKKFEDAEATVTGHKNGSGRCADMLGAIFVKEDDGTTFKIGSGFTDQLRKNPPKKGARVTFKFQGRSELGVPRFPIFLREHPGM